MRAASEAGTGIARTLSVALAALLAFSQAPARAEEAIIDRSTAVRNHTTTCRGQAGT
jgi:hypothetical protein